MNKRGVSAVVATVLIILITVASVTIFWGAIIPMTKGNLDFSSLEGKVSVLTSGGYTYYDSDTGIDEFPEDSRLEITFEKEGEDDKRLVIERKNDDKTLYSFYLDGNKKNYNQYGIFHCISTL